MTRYLDHQKDLVTKLIDMIESNKGEKTWQMPWVGHESLLFATNAVTKNAYRGSNTINLAIEGIDRKFTTGEWATFNQWKSVNAQVQGGQKASYIVKWIKPEFKDGEDDREDRFKGSLIPRVYAVFNADQVSGYTPETLELPTPSDPIQAVEDWLDAVGAEGSEGNGASYSPTTDKITMPHFEKFKSAEGFYATALHEHMHWTGHKSRLDRDQTGAMNTDGYALEELVAELGSAIACSKLGLVSEPREDHALYLEHWLNELKANPKVLFSAARDAQKAFDYLDDAAKGMLKKINTPTDARYQEPAVA